MDWEHETRRFLYVRVDAKWAALPLSARSLASELLKYADEDGSIYKAPGESLADAVFRVTQAHRHERKRIEADVALLLGDGYLVETEPHGRIRNFVAAQGIVPQTPEERSEERSRSAIRASEWRARKRRSEGVRERSPNAFANADERQPERVRERSPNAFAEPDPNAFASRAIAPPGAHAGAAARVPVRSVPVLPEDLPKTLGLPGLATTCGATHTAPAQQASNGPRRGGI